MIRKYDNVLQALLKRQRRLYWSVIDHERDPFKPCTGKGRCSNYHGLCTTRSRFLDARRERESFMNVSTLCIAGSPLGLGFRV